MNKYNVSVTYFLHLGSIMSVENRHQTHIAAEGVRVKENCKKKRIFPQFCSDRVVLQRPCYTMHTVEERTDVIKLNT